MSSTVLSAANSLINSTYSSLVKYSTTGPNLLCRTLVITLMSRIKRGQLRVLTVSDGAIYTFPPPSSDDEVEGPRAELRVLNESFWLRLVLQGDLGFSEAYMMGEVECDDLISLFKIFILNRPDPPSSSSSSSKTSAVVSQSISGVSSLPTKVVARLSGFLNEKVFDNDIRGSKKNIAGHYDLGNDMFSAFLSPDMTYSCALFPSLDGDLSSSTISSTSGSENLLRLPLKLATQDDEKKRALNREREVRELEEAQYAKLRLIIKKADLKKGDRVLEIGTGWGSFAIEAVKQTGCVIDTLTLSTQQALLARERIASAGLQDSITVHLLDYRSLPTEWKGRFDRVVSIEMIEAVGKDWMSTYWSQVGWALNERGCGVFQVITIPEGRFENYQREVDFIQKWIFPGGFLPSFTFLVESIKKGTNEQFIVDDVCNIGPHYARTLRTWKNRFLASFDSHILPSLLRDHPGMDAEDVAVFKKKWMYYFNYCEVGFTTRIIGVHVFRITKEGNEGLACEVFAPSANPEKEK